MNKRVSRVFCVLFLLLELAIVPRAVELMLGQHLSYLPPVQIVILSMTFGSIALYILMAFSAMSEQSSYPTHTFLFELMVFLCCVAPVTDLFTRTLDSAGRPGMSMLVNTVFYLVGINMAYVIMRYEFLIVGMDGKPMLKKLRKWASVLMVLDNAATLLNIRFGFFFTITENGGYRSAPTFWLSYIAPLLIVAATVVVAAREMKPGRQKRAFLYFWVFTIVTMVLQVWREDLTLQYTGYALTMLVIYVNVQNELDTTGADPLQEEVE